MWIDNPKKLEKEKWVRKAVEESKFTFNYFSEEDLKSELEPDKQDCILVSVEDLDSSFFNVKEEIISIDTETDGVEGEIHGVGLYSESYCHYLFFPQGSSGSDLSVFQRGIEKLSSRNTLVAHNAEYDIYVLIVHCNVFIKIEDTQLQYYTLDCLNNHFVKLSTLANKYLYRYPASFSSLMEAYDTNSIWDIPTKVIGDYCVEDCYEVERIYRILENKLREKGSLYLYTHEKYLPYTLTLSRYFGFPLDLSKCEYIKHKLSKEKSSVEKSLKNLYDLKEVKVSSTKWLQWFLFDFQEITPLGYTKTGLGKTDEGSISELAKENYSASLVKRWKKAESLLSKFIDSLPKFVKEDENIHPHFNCKHVKTGRISCKDPNLMQIPSPQGGEEFASIRSIFVAPEGYKLVGADYPGIELRILAYLSNCKSLIDIFKNGGDPHNQKTCEVFNIPYEEFDKEKYSSQRKIIKNLNYGSAYGMSAHRLYSLMKNAGYETSIQECENILEKFWDSVPEIAEYLSQVKLLAFYDGEVFTFYGRRRSVRIHTFSKGGNKRESLLKELEYYVQECKNGKITYRKAWNEWLQKLDKYDREQGREIGNYLIQGHNADCVRMAMSQYATDLSFEEKKNCRLLLNIHDELVFAVKVEYLDFYWQYIKDLMENAIPLGGIPVEVEPQIAVSWDKLK